MSPKRILLDGARQIGLRIGKKALATLDVYTRELMEGSRRINLTGHRDREKIEIFHYLDSLSLFQTGLIGPGASVLDVGSGAGFPGLPLKILEPSLALTLLECSERRGNFLRYLVRTLGLPDVRVEIARAEDFGRQRDASFQRILCRAVGSMAKVCSWTAPLLEAGGRYVFQKSRKVTQEIEDLRDPLSALGLEVLEVQSLLVPYLDRPRYAVIIGKTRR